MKILARECSPYNDIYVIRNGEYRELWFKGNGDYFLQSRVDIRKQKQLALVYSNMLMSSLLFCPNPRRLLMIGLGGGSVSNFLSDWFPELKIDVVEIDEKVIEISKKYFFLQESNRYRIFQEDGRMFIKSRKQQEQYDWVILDAFKSGSIPYHLKTHEFYKEIRSILKPNGVVGSNLYGQGNSLKPRDTRTFLSVFPNIYCFEDAERVATVLIANGGPRWSKEQIHESAQIFNKMPEPFSMKEVAENYREGEFIEESAKRFDDHFSDKGFLHDVKKENLQNIKTRRYPIKNIH
ncbi:MAG: fused MFS/spermidine synthase [Nitrospinota bacterium]|nr:fused MFS/spermidine synthase [Nitrospinota bacterium]